MKIFTCRHSQSLRDFTDCTYPQGSFCFAQLLRGKDIKVNGARVGKNVALKAGDEVTYYTTPRQESMPSHSQIYCDENIAVLDKPCGVSFEGLYSELNTYGGFYPVHRLDRNTCGVIVFAKNEAAQRELIRAFKNRGVEKTYIAVCKNQFKAPAATLRAYVKKDADNALVTVYDAPGAGLQKIITGYKVLKENNDIALVEIALRTGKTHQIRAHMAHIGCPVLGDNKYGDGELNKKYAAARQCLVSKRLTFTGLTGKFAALNGMEFESGFKTGFPQILPKP